MNFDYWAHWNWVGDTIGAALITGCALGYFSLRCLRSDVKAERNFYIIILGALGLRLILVLVLNLTNWVPAKYYWDSASYQRFAIQIAVGQPIPYLSESVHNFTWLLSRLFLLLGFVPITIGVISSLAGTFVVRNVYRTTEILGSPTSAAIVAGIWAILPSNVFVTSQPFRDPFIFLIISLLIYWVVRIERSEEGNIFILAGGAIVLSVSLCFFRPHQMIFATASLVLAALATFVRSHKKSVKSVYCMRGLGAVAIVSFLFINCGSLNGFDLISQYSQHMYSQLSSKRITYTNLVPFNEEGGGTTGAGIGDKSKEVFAFEEKGGVQTGFVRDDMEEAGTLLSYVTVQDKTALQFIYRIPLRMLIFVLSPFPWQNQSLFLKITIFENFILYIFLITGLTMVPYFYRNHKEVPLFLLAYIFVATLAYSLVEGNVGTAYRHRMQFTWALFIPGAIQLSLWFRGRVSRHQ